MNTNLNKVETKYAARAAESARASWHAAKDIAGGPPGHTAI